MLNMLQINEPIKDVGPLLALTANPIYEGDKAMAKSTVANQPAKSQLFKVTHGLTHHPLYRVWTFMRHRCSAKSCEYYRNYGGRGISVCDEWQEFKPFYDWAIGNGWKKGLILDREDNNGNYTPENCRFVDAKTSIANQRLIKTNNTSGYRGVSFRKDKNRYRAYMEVNGKTKWIGSFKSAKEAAVMRDCKVSEYNLGYPLNFAWQ